MDSTLAPSTPALDDRPTHRRRWFGGTPAADTGVAALTLAGLWLANYLEADAGVPFAFTLVILVGGTAVPVWTIARSGAPWADLGITRRNAGWSFAVSAVLGAGGIALANRLAQDAGVSLTTQLLSNLLMLWEPFFLFGWLYLRWEKAFGILPAVVLVGLGSTLQHLGAMPVADAVGLGCFAPFFAAVFATTRNLLIAWPLFYPAATTVVTLRTGLVFGWDEVAFGIVLLMAQVAVALAIIRRATRQKRS